MASCICLTEFLEQFLCACIEVAPVVEEVIEESIREDQYETNLDLCASNRQQHHQKHRRADPFETRPPHDFIPQNEKRRNKVYKKK